MADTTVINWKSFCKPAILPLTTDFMPSANELNSANLYAQYPHTLSLIPDENDFGNEPAHLLQELLSQRLAQDFQIVVWKTVIYYFCRLCVPLKHIFIDALYTRVAHA